MGKVFLGFPNRCTLPAANGGGSWLAALPAANAFKPELAEVARSTDALTASTQLRGNFSTPRALRAFALVNHNLSPTATWNVLLGTTAGASNIYAGTPVGWLQTTFEAGLVAAGMEDGEYLRDGTPAIIVLPAFYTAQHVTFQVQDTGNPDGYVQVGRVFAGGGFSAEVNPKHGMKDGWIDKSTRVESESGSEHATKRRRLKRVSLEYDSLTMEEGEQLHEMQRVLGTVDEVLYVPDDEDPARTQRFGMLGTLAELSPLDYPYPRTRALPIEIRQKA